MDLVKTILLAIVLQSVSVSLLAAELQASSIDLQKRQLSLTNLQGRRQVLSLPSTQLTIVHFWASWCVPCREELPALGKLIKALNRKDLRVVSIAADSHEQVNQFQQQATIPGQILIDQYGSALRVFGVQAMPSSYILNRQGHVIYRARGAVDWLDDKVIQKLLRQLNAN